MSDLLNAVLDAYGGLDRWRQFNRVQATIVTGGGLWAIKGQPQDPRPRRMTVALDHEWASLTPFGADDQRTAFTPERIAIEKLDGRVVSERLNPRESFDGHEFATPWDPLQRAYFNGYALWNYLTTPFLLALDGVSVREIDPVEDNGQTWGACRRTFHPESQRTLPFKSSTSETTTSCVAMITGSTWREGFLPSITFTARSRPRASRFPDNAGRIAPTPKATRFPISSWSRSMSATSVSSRALGRAQSGNDVAKAEGEGCSSWA